ncbi:QcrA and Rieske domain-containing protein [Mucilaginibacter agri]|uniref:Rieske 2Fe-2S domain-containing protein n=1 Tax=Mucilaginibacter agri TaxID=2695265 RepID=A0A965ZJC7_9SPHI|nr:Rieske (2Fe-2S) protein [Mucilaginibacter agri]NCD71173.1 Rieske 2Fe-2S domain-containing protein [Mucilaginibacter agri]
MERRDFIKQSCALCMIAAAGAVISNLSSCATLPVYQTAINNQQVTVPTSLFDKGNLQIVQPKGLFYNIALNKEADGSYTALLLRCTHADNQLITTGNGYKCNLHGSAFDKEGHVTVGPAEKPLRKYPTEINNGQIIIHLT